MIGDESTTSRPSPSPASTGKVCTLTHSPAAAPAHAGTYVVHSCAFPDGSPAPIDGWSYRWNCHARL